MAKIERHKLNTINISHLEIEVLKSNNNTMKITNMNKIKRIIMCFPLIFKMGYSDNS